MSVMPTCSGCGVAKTTQALACEECAPLLPARLLHDVAKTWDDGDLLGNFAAVRKAQVWLRRYVNTATTTESITSGGTPQ